MRKDQHIHYFFFNDTATTEIYTLSLHDALPIYFVLEDVQQLGERPTLHGRGHRDLELRHRLARSEEHTSELQSRPHLVCRLLLEKKKSTMVTIIGSSNRRVRSGAFSIILNVHVY